MDNNQEWVVGSCVKIKIMFPDGTELDGEGVVDSFTMAQDNIEVTVFGDSIRKFIPGSVKYKLNATLNSFSSESGDIKGNGLRKNIERLTRKLDG